VEVGRPQERAGALDALGIETDLGGGGEALQGEEISGELLVDPLGDRGGRVQAGVHRLVV
jgi:hypothetical protein